MTIDSVTKTTTIEGKERVTVAVMFVFTTRQHTHIHIHVYTKWKENVVDVMHIIDLEDAIYIQCVMCYISTRRRQSESV